MPDTIRDDAALDALTLAVTLHKLTAGMSDEMVNELRAVGARLETSSSKSDSKPPAAWLRLHLPTRFDKNFFDMMA
jgi:hypothetical protein